MGKNYSNVEIGTLKTDLAEKKRVMLGEQLGLTGSEVSVNYAPAGTYTPFVHSHKLNEELYIILSGKGMFMVDGEEFAVKEGSAIRVAPLGVRAIKADEDMAFICVQAQNESLTQATHDDGVIGGDFKASWMED